MRVLVDSSVWSLTLRKGGPADHPAVVKLARLLADGEDVFLCGIVLQEVLQAFRSEAVFKRVWELLSPFRLLLTERADHVSAARIHRECASKGVTAGTVDCLIAHMAIRHDCLLLTGDQDFTFISKCCPLQLM